MVGQGIVSACWHARVHATQARASSTKLKISIITKTLQEDTNHTFSTAITINLTCNKS